MIPNVYGDAQNRRVYNEKDIVVARLLSRCAFWKNQIL
nr:hypothetical protein [Clostridium sp. Marseille-P299]